MKENKRRRLSNSLKFILLFVMFIVLWVVFSYFTGIKLTTIVFYSIILAMIMSIVVNIFNLDKNRKKDPQQRRHIVARYKFKGLWYLVATIATIVLMIDELGSPSNDGVLILNSILVFIVLYECIDNYKSYSVENNKLKSETDNVNISVNINEKNKTDNVNTSVNINEKNETDNVNISVNISEKNETDNVNISVKLENELSDLKVEVGSLKSNNLSERINSGVKVDLCIGTDSAKRLSTLYRH